MSSPHRHPIFSRLYPRIAHTAERGGGAAHRRTLLDGLSGRVIEVGAGHGLNFPYYGEGVTQVVAVEPEPYLRGLAEHAASTATVPIDVREGIAEALPAEDAEFDVVVASLVLCSVEDQRVALGEIARVLRPQGELRFYEHVISNRPGMARMQRWADATIYPHLAGGCHAARYRRGDQRRGLPDRTRRANRVQAESAGAGDPAHPRRGSSCPIARIGNGAVLPLTGRPRSARRRDIEPAAVPDENGPR